MATETIVDTDPPHDSPALVDPIQAARMLGVAPQTLSNWRCTHKGPAFVRLGRTVIRYRVSDLLEFIEENLVVMA